MAAGDGGPASTAPRTLGLYLVRARANPRDIKGKTKRTQGDSIWVYNEYTDTTTFYENGSDNELPCELQDGDIITCYDPGDTTEAEEPDVVGFEVYQVPEPEEDDEPVIDYNFDDDELEVDLSVVDAFAENYDTTADPPYTGETNDGSIGIDG